MRRTDEFLTQLRGEEDDEFFDDVSAMRQTTRESIQSQHEWHRREEFRRSTSGWGNVYEEGRSSSHGSVTGHHGERSIPNESKFNLRGAILELVKSKSLRQPKVGESILKTLRKKMGEAVPKFLIYEQFPFQLANSPWFYNLIQVSMEVGKGVKLPTPYEVSDVYLASEYEQAREWVNGLKTQWKELTHCLDLCLEDIGKKSNVARVLEEVKKVTCFIYNHIWTVDLMKKYTNGKQILQPALTRFATHFIQLEEITRQKQEKENPLLDGENAGLFPADSSNDEINFVDQFEEQNLSDSSSSATPTQSGGHG
ncbi:hypothetical protein V6N12_045357 [Hibiscus sabdariffa]|uniref:Uncharacterized protein n=1 Tax=Hibiscus sabdariffa TaxID=183260 RepID=A0ABR2G3E6_9ROSI